MKNFVLFLLFNFILQTGFSYTWISYGPEGIKATNLFYYDEELALIIMSDSGFYLRDENLPDTWQHFNYQMKEAVLLNPSTVLFVAGGGSYPDGIYSLHLPTLQVEQVEDCINPYFIKYFDNACLFYAGYDNGLLKSANGLDWEAVDFFTGRMCIGMDHYNGHWIVNTVAAVTHLFLSDDNGNTWTESIGNPGLISAMAFADEGKLYGVFPSTSYSSGLWSSEDYGDTWEIEFYTTNLNTVNATSLYGGKLLVGWTNSETDDKGIAIYDPDVPLPGLIFLNENLPNTNINKIDFVELLDDVGILIVCTDTGVYYCPDYFVGSAEIIYPPISVQITPNPAKEEAFITIENPDHIDLLYVYIINSFGKIVNQIMTCRRFSGKFERKSVDLPAGIYYLMVRTKNETLTEKFIIL